MSPLIEEGLPAGAVEPLFPQRCPQPPPGFTLVPPCRPGRGRTPGSPCLASGGFLRSGVANRDIPVIPSPFAKSMDNINKFRMSNILVWGTKRKKNNSFPSLRGEAPLGWAARKQRPGVGACAGSLLSREAHRTWLQELALCPGCRCDTGAPSWGLAVVGGTQRWQALWPLSCAHRPCPARAQGPQGSSLLEAWVGPGRDALSRLLPAPRGQGPTPALGARTPHPALLHGALATAKGVGRSVVVCTVRIY